MNIADFSLGASSQIRRKGQSLMLSHTLKAAVLSTCLTIGFSVAASTNIYPDADTVLLRSVNHEEYQVDGTSTSWSSDKLQILTEAGRRASRTRNFHFNISYGTVTVVRAEIIKPTGLIVTVDVARASKVMTETSQMAANIYDPDNKVLKLSLADLEIGDTLSIDTRRTNYKARVPGVWSDYNLFEYTMPIEHLSYTVVAPKALPLRHLRLRDAITNTVSYSQTEDETTTTHHWEVQNIPQIFPEPNMPPLHTVAQRLIVSTAEDWPSLSRWYWNLSLPRLAATSPAITNQVKSLIADVDSPEQKMRRIFTWVSQNIRYMGITIEDEAPGYEPHDVCITFENRYGVCRDKAALLVEMLRIAGLEAYPVLIHAGAKLDPDVPMTFFNHAVVAAKLPGDAEYTLMDPTDESTPDPFPAYLGNRSYLVAHPDGETLKTSPVIPATQNMVRITSHGHLDNTARLKLDTDIAFDGVNDTIYRGHFLRLPREQRRRFFEGLAKARLPGAELLDFQMLPENLQDTDQPLRVRMSLQVSDYPLQGANRTLVELPWLSGSLGIVNQLLGQTGLEKRRFALETELACGNTENFSIQFDDTLGSPISLPESIKHDTIGIYYNRHLNITNQTLQGTLEFRLDQPSYPSKDYQAIRQLRRDIEYSARQKAHFIPGALGTTPDRIILSDNTRVELDSPHTWTTTRRLTQQILTYAGTKRYSEIRLNFNPIWQSSDLVDAVVSNANGSVHHIKPSEINLMDASWSGGAPRYPAAKTRVISLPGVETGSVITTVTRFTQKNAPFFSFQTSFQSTDPIQHKVVEVIMPANLSLQISDSHPALQSSWQPLSSNIVLRKWESYDQPAIVQEENLPPSRVFLPTLRISSGNWPDYASRVAAAAKSARRNSSKATARALEIVNAIHHPQERILAIRDFVMRSIRIAGPGFTKLPLQFTPVDQTLSDGYGHSADRALLLATMLRAIGQEAEPILVDSSRSESSLTSDELRFPHPSQFDSMLVALAPRRPNLLQLIFARQQSATPIYLNDGDQYTTLGVTKHYNHPALQLEGELTTIKSPVEFQMRTQKKWIIELDADGTAYITVSNSFFGPLSASFRKLYSEMPPEKLSRHYQELVANISQSAAAATPLHPDLESYPATLTFKVEATRYAVVNKDNMTLLLPAPEALLPLRGDRRYNPLWVSANKTIENSTYEIILPREYQKISLIPKDHNWNLPGGLGRHSSTTRKELRSDGRLQLTIFTEKTIDSALIDTEQYPALLEYNRLLAHPASRTLVVE